jgi:aldehyde:ferredoxin oxidoreductase
MDSLILCKFLRGVFENFYQESAEMLEMVTGWKVNAEELEETAQRIVTARKWFNIRAGWQPAEDTLPDRFFSESLADDDRARMSRDDLQESIRTYYRHRGWSDDGWIQQDHLQRLGIDPSEAQNP